MVICTALGALLAVLLGMAGRPGYAFQVSLSGVAQTVAQRAADPSPLERYAVFCEREPECHERAASLCGGDYAIVPSEG